jgi:hypothetical protein
VVNNFDGGSIQVQSVLPNASLQMQIPHSIMDLFPNEQNIDQNKSGQKFHHSLKEHHKISNIPKFRCEML